MSWWRRVLGRRQIEGQLEKEMCSILSGTRLTSSPRGTILKFCTST
jgi:hypothetical protein